MIQKCKNTLYAVYSSVHRKKLTHELQHRLRNTNARPDPSDYKMKKRDWPKVIPIKNRERFRSHRKTLTQELQYRLRNTTARPDPIGFEMKKRDWPKVIPFKNREFFKSH